MMKWLLQTLGVGDDLIARLDQATLAVQRPGLLWVGLALLVPIGYFIVARQRRNLATTTPGLRAALGATRILVLLALVLVLSGPYLKLDYELDRRPIVALAFDRSQSMNLPAGPFEGRAEIARLARAAGYHVSAEETDADTRQALDRMPRLKLAQSVVQANAKSMTEPLAKKFDVRYYGFSREPETLGLDPAHPEFPEVAPRGGAATHLGDAISRVIDDAAGRPIAGLFLFTDGQNTGGRSPSEAAALASRLGAPIFSVPTGSPVRPSDVAIVDVFTSGLVAVGDTARVAVTLESQNFDNRPVKVELRDGDNLLDTEEITLHGGEQQKVELTFTAKETGAKYLTVNVPPLPEEPEHLRPNNSDVAFIRIGDERLKVLYVEGTARWDFRFLKNALRRDHGIGGRHTKEQPDLALEAELRHRSAEARAKALPASLDELAEYHTVILGDASPKLLSPAFVAMLAEAVREKGLGLIVEAGPKSMPQEFDEKFKELLPVRLRPSAGGLDAPAYRPFKLDLSPDGSIHEVMRLYDDPGRNQAAWRQMPAFFWCAAVERPAPAASVLAWNPSVEGRFGKLPLIAYHYAGKGRVVFVGFDSTFLWRQNVGDRFFYKFWGQAVRFVARRDDKSQKSWIEVRPVRAQPGEEAQVELMAFTADGQPRIDRAISIQVAGEGTASNLELLADPATQGRYTGKLTLEKAGDYRLRYEPGGDAKPAEAKIRVTDAPEELRHPSVNRPALELLASATNGKLVELTDLGSIPPTLKGESKQIQVHREASLWDNWLTLAVIMVVYSLDVALRRLAGLS